MRPTPKPIRIVARLDCGVVVCLASASALAVVEGKDASSGLDGVGATKTVVRTVVIDVAEGVAIVVSTSMLLPRSGIAVLDVEGMVIEVEYPACDGPASEVLPCDHME